MNNKKEKHKQQLIEEIIQYFNTFKSAKNITKEKLNKLNYRKVKQISKALGIYRKYYDNSLTDADYYSWYRL